MTDAILDRDREAPAAIGFFEKYLTVWVALCIVAGIALGYLMPGFVGVVAQAEVARVNIPVAVLIWLMIVPMLLKVDFASMAKVGAYWRGIGVTLFINWAIKPFRWRCSDGSSSAGCSAPISRRTRSIPTSRA
jgi:arsenite transporter